MNFDLCKNKYFHISEGNMNIEVSVTGNNLVYGSKTRKFYTKKEASHFLNFWFKHIKNNYAKNVCGKNGREWVVGMVESIFKTMPESDRMGDF